MTEKTLTAKKELYEIAEFLQEADRKEKEGKAYKEEVRGPFMELISEVIREEIPLERKAVEIPYANDPIEYIQRNYPEWKIIGIETELVHDEIVTVALLEEEESLKKYEFIHNGFRFGRTLRQGTPSFDAEKYYKDWEGYPDYQTIIKVETVTTYSLDEKKAQKMMVNNPGIKDTLENYITRPKPTVSLLPIKAVEEE